MGGVAAVALWALWRLRSVTNALAVKTHELESMKFAAQIAERHLRREIEFWRGAAKFEGVHSAKTQILPIGDRPK
jgi:hypothetical protein